MSDIAAIAGALTEAQRRCAAGDRKRFSWRTHQALMDAGILESVGGFLVRTPLGQRVRDHLISKEML